MREPVIPQLTASEFLAWEAEREGKFELHHGFVMAFAGGTVDHDRVAFNVRAAFERRFPAPCRSFGSDVKVHVAGDTYYYADVGVVCSEVAGDLVAIEDPIVVVEVLSRSTRAYDIIEKRASYRAMPSLKSYVLVHTDMRRVEVDIRSRDPGGWRTETYDEGTAFVAGVELLLDEVYARSSLAT